MKTEQLLITVLLLQYARATFLRVETGHENIAIEGRDTYYGHYTKVHFHNVTCIDAIDIHCLKELTGAEEIDLLYSECQKGHWKVAHYANAKHHFRLKEPIHALRLLISSRRELSVIDAQVKSCSFDPPTPSECHRPTRSHNHRHGKGGSVLKAVDPYVEQVSEEDHVRSRRVRRDAVPENTSEVLNGTVEIIEDKIVPEGHSLRIVPGTHLKFQKDVGLVVYGNLKVEGTIDHPVIMERASLERWKGVEFRNAKRTCVLSNVKISGSVVAVNVVRGFAPIMSHLQVFDNEYGIKIKETEKNSTTQLSSVTSVNNEKTGIEYLGKGSVTIEKSVSASNGELGMFIATESRVILRQTTSYSNNGTGIYVGTSEVVMEDVVVNANGFYGVHAEIDNRLEMQSVNVSAHRSSFSVELFLAENAKIGIANSFFHDNKMGGIRVAGNFRGPTVIMRSCRFTRNSGETIVFNNFSNASLIIDKCSFTSNSYLDFDAGDSVVSIKNVSGDGNQLAISNNRFTKNAMHDVIKVFTSSEPASSSIQISFNEFQQNIANSIVTTNSSHLNITENKFENRRATCEVTVHPPATPENLEMNNFSSRRICTGQYEAVQMDQAPSSTAGSYPVSNNPFVNHKGNVVASEEPYKINEEVTIHAGETVVVDPGTILDFAPGVGITVAGRLVLNGTEDRPIVVRGQSGNSWRGIVVKPEGVLDARNVVSEDASIGYWIDSEKVRIQSGRIVRPTVHGIEITQNSDDVVDLGGVVIEEANESAIGVDERRDDLLIKDVVVRNGGGSGIDFMTPTGNIEIQNVKIDNIGGYGIHISEFPSSPLHAVLLDNVTVTNQKRGHAGVLISGGWIENVGMNNMVFTDNSVPSLIVALECNDGNEKLIRMENSVFERNTDIVHHVQLANCVNLQMEKNRYNENNADGIGSNLVITSDSNGKKTNGVMEMAKNNFTNNGGIYTMTVDSNIHDVYLTDNFLTGNKNSGAVLKIGGENVKLVTNNFDNEGSRYQIAYSDESPLDASFNEWNGLTDQEVLDSIDAREGSVLVHTPSTTTVPSGNQLDVTPVTIPDSLNVQCAHLNYCSRRGTCRDGICICPPGFAGFDCGIPLFCNCSGNGLCNLLNVCMCNEGWSGADCSVPKCSCQNNGKCVAPNLCECAPGWTGPECGTSSCVDSQCSHGHCSSGLCKCDEGWQGSRCQIPVCHNCSINGVCTVPGFCSCFEDYGGIDCTKCIGDSCEACDFDCNHGTCEPLTKTCSCSKGWSGGACDVCLTGKCEDSSRIQYILPATAELEDTNAVVNVFGDGFSITDNNTYICTFGRTSVSGHRTSSSLVRCPIPANLTLGRHVFSVSRPGELNTIGNSEAKPIHFTLYDGCEPSICQGSCVGPLCICPQGKTGLFCDVIEILPSIDKRFLEHQRANQAFEGVPYVLMLPTMSSSVLRVNSTIPNLNFIASKGIIAWPEPIGSEDPYEISVTAFSPAGETTIAWNITVAPEYAVEVANVTVDSGKATVFGRLVGNGPSRKSPVIIRIRRDDTVDEILAESGSDGSIVYEYIPMLSGVYDVTIAHPNVHTDSVQPVRFTIPEINLPIVGESSNSSLVLDIGGRNDCEVRLIQPRVENPEIGKQDSRWVIQFGREWTGEVLASVECGEDPMEIVRAPPIETGVVPTSPEVLSIYGTHHIYEVKVHSPSHPFFTPDVDVSDEGLQYLSAIPEERFLRMTFSSAASLRNNGTIQVNDGAKPLATIPFFYAAANKSGYYNFRICVRDEWDGQEGVLASNEVATVAIQNPQRGVDVTRSNIRFNVQWADFSLQPGIYRISVRSELHEPLDEVVELSPLNTTFCVPMTSSKSRNLPSIHCSEYPESCDVAITSIATTNDLPYLHFEPSVVKSSGQKVLVSPRGNLPGTIGLWNSDADGVSVTPSRRSVAINESFWITFGWKSMGRGIRTLDVPFVFLPNQSHVPVHSTSTILMKFDSDSQIIMDKSNTPVQPATSTAVMCNCGDGARSRCRERYHSATACGGAWSKIADDTVSLEVLSAFLAMIFECREVSVDFRELQQSLECVASIESECPINSRRKRQVQNDSPFGIIGHLNSSPNFAKVLPVLNALDVQTIRISSVFIEFVERVQKMFPESVIGGLNREAVDHFLGAISDQSEEGMMISEAERRIIGEGGFRLIQLWNLTVKSWTSGKVQTERLGIGYQDVKLLVEAADKIKSISRQNVAQDPFSMLHGYMERMLETGETEQKECATTTVFIDNTEVEEDGQIRVQVFIKNLSNSTLTNIGVSLSFAKSDQKTATVNFNIGPSWSAGISSLSGLGMFQMGSNIEIHWTRFVAASRRLTTVAKYQPIIIFSFSSMGRVSRQKLFAPEVSVIPKKTIRAINIIKDDLSPKEGTDFSIITSIINPGYSALKNVQILMDDLEPSTNLKLDSVFLNGKLSHKSLSPQFTELPSGSTQLIRVIMRDHNDTISPISSMNLTCLENGQLLPLETTETYAIRAAGISDFGMLLAMPDQSAPLFYFRPSAAQMVNVIKLEFLSTQKINSTDSTKTSYVAAFKNPESSSFGGALWARMRVPKVGDNHKLVSIIDRGGSRPRELQAVQWISEENGNEMLNWIDPGTFTTQQMIYELQFSNPDSSSDDSPTFDQLQYRIEIPQSNLEPETEIGRIEAEGDDVSYYLYSPDNERRFSVDSETGRIFYDSDEPLKEEQEYCVVLEARDADGRVTRVPVAINNGGQRRDCVLFSTAGLSPSVYFGPIGPVPTPDVFTTRTLATTRPTTITWETTVSETTPSIPTTTIVTAPDVTPSEYIISSSTTEAEVTTNEYTTPFEISTESTSTTEVTASSETSTTSGYTTTVGIDGTTSSETSTTSPSDTTVGTSTESESTETTRSDIPTPATLAIETTTPTEVTSEAPTTIVFVDSTLESVTTQMTSEATTTSSLTTLESESESTTPIYLTSAFPTPFTLQPVTSTTSSEDTITSSTHATSPDLSTLETITTTSSETSSPSDYTEATTTAMTSPDSTLPNLDITTTSESTLSPTTTETVYTITSDETLPPITTITTPSEVTLQPPIHVSTIGGNDVYTTLPTTTTPSATDPDPDEIDCDGTKASLSPFSIIICDIQGISKKRQRSQPS